MAIGATRTTSPERLTALAAVAPTSPTTRTAVSATPAGSVDAWPAGWTSPDALPDGARVAAVHDLETGDLRVDLVVDGHEVTVLEAEGGFRFSNLPDGSWFLIAPVKADDDVMVLMRRVQTRGGRAVNVTLGG